MVFSLDKHNLRNIQVHSATCSCIIDLYPIQQQEQLYRTFADFFPNCDFSRNFSYAIYIVYYYYVQEGHLMHFICRCLFLNCSVQRPV